MFIAFDRENEQAFGPFDSEDQAHTWTRGLLVALGEVASVEEADKRIDTAFGFAFIEVQCVDAENETYEEWRGAPLSLAPVDPENFFDTKSSKEEEAD